MTCMSQTGFVVCKLQSEQAASRTRLIETVKVALQNPLAHRRGRSFHWFPTGAQSSIEVVVGTGGLRISSVGGSCRVLIPGSEARGNDRRFCKWRAERKPAKETCSAFLTIVTNGKWGLWLKAVATCPRSCCSPVNFGCVRLGVLHVFSLLEGRTAE